MFVCVVCVLPCFSFALPKGSVMYQKNAFQRLFNVRQSNHIMSPIWHSNTELFHDFRKNLFFTALFLQPSSLHSSLQCFPHKPLATACYVQPTSEHSFFVVPFWRDLQPPVVKTLRRLTAKSPVLAADIWALTTTRVANAPTNQESDGWDSHPFAHTKRHASSCKSDHAACSVTFAFLECNFVKEISVLFANMGMCITTTIFETNCTKGCLTGPSSTNQCIASVIIMENCHASWALVINFLCHIVEDVSCPGIGLSNNLLGTLLFHHIFLELKL